MTQLGSRKTGGVVKIAVSTGGTGYTSPPSVSVVGGGGTGAAAQAHISGSRVESIVITNAGSGFTSSPTISLTGGGGTGAAATAYAHTGSVRPMTFFKGRYSDMYGVDGMGRGVRWDGASTAVGKIGLVKPAVGPAVTASTTSSSGYVSKVQIVSGGAGYQNTPTVTFSGGTPSVAAKAIAAIDNGRVSAITVTDRGSGYQSVPSVAVAGGVGTGASLNVGVVGWVNEIDLTTVGAGYTADATTSPSVVFSSEQGLYGALATVSVDSLGRISSVALLSSGTGATTSGVTASIVGGGGAGASLWVRLAYSVASVTAASTGSGYYTEPVITFRPAKSDPFGSGAAATAIINGLGNVTGATVYAGGEYSAPPTASIFDTSAKAVATLSKALSGKYKCCIRYLDDTPSSKGGPLPSSISDLVEVDAGSSSGSFTWSFSHAGLDDRVKSMELWRTTSGQSVLLFRVATIQRSDAAFTGSYVDSIPDEDLIDTDRDGYGLMPITLPSGQLNARRFEVPPPEFAVATMFQDRAWYAVDTSGERPNSLMYSEVDEPESVPAENELVVQENTGTPDAIVALIPLGGNLLVVQKSHIYKLTYVAQPVIDASIVLAGYRGILNQRCWDVLGGVAFIADGSGLYAFDGQQEEAVSAAVDDRWRSGEIDFSKASKFHVRADSSTRTIRFYYCRSGDSEPVRAMCYCVATKAWWDEEYPTAITATCAVMLNDRRAILSGTSSGGFLKEGGVSDSGAAIPYELRTGNAALATTSGSRSVAVVYRPTPSDSSLQVRLHYNNSETPRANAISSDRGDGFATTLGSTAAVLNMKKSRSALGDSNGFARAHFSGRRDELSSGGDRHVAVAIAGTQSGTSSSDAVVIHSVLIEGAE